MACADSPTALKQGNLKSIGAPLGTVVTGGAFTTTNPTGTDGGGTGGTPDGTGHCRNGNEAVNCNIYDGKKYVWMNGGPAAAQIGGAGQYFFAVLQPGGQGGGRNPNDGMPKNLSDQTLDPWGGGTNSDGSTRPAGDAYTNRTFTVDATGHITAYSGNHDFANGKIRLMPYDDTPNNGGVYIMAICSLADGLPVDPSKCKYDAFKVQVADGGGETPGAELLTVDKNAAGGYTKTFAWNIVKDATPVLVSQASGSAAITYNVTVSHVAANDAIGAYVVNGTITVHNPNPDNVHGAIVSDVLSNATTCSVTGGGSVGNEITLDPGESTFLYSCSLGNTDPGSSLTNTVTLSWPAQTLNVGSLPAGPAHFTSGAISFSQTSTVNETVNVTDLFNGGSAVPIGTLLSPVGTSTVSVSTAPRTFTYVRNIPVTANQCVSYTNTARITETGQNDDATVQICGPVTGGLTIGFWSNKNGAKVLCANDPGWRNLLDGLPLLTNGGSYLRNANASFYAVPTTGTCSAADANFSSWLLSASATNMSYMLSAQLAGTRLNVAYNGMNGNLLVSHPITHLPATINSIIAEAVTFLRANGNTTASGVLRDQAAAYKDLFDGLNNQHVTVVPGP